MAYCAIETADGGYIFSANSQSESFDVTKHKGIVGWGDIWIVKTDAAGNITWEKSMGGSLNEGGGNYIEQSSLDGSYIVAGTTASNDSDVHGLHSPYIADMWLISLKPDGSFNWRLVIGGDSSDSAVKIKHVRGGGYIVAGYTKSTNGDATGCGLHGMSSDIWVLKLSAPAVADKITAEKNIIVYPSFTSGKVFVDLPQGYEGATIELFNIQGQSIPVITGGSSLNRTVHLYNTPSGTYILQVSNKGEVYSQKIVYRQ